MTLASRPIADRAYGDFGGEGGSADPLAQKLLRGEAPDTVLLARIGYREVAATTPYPADGDAIGALAIGDMPDVAAGAAADQSILVADGQWCGRPDDFGAANLEAEPRLVELGALQEEVPYLPEQDRRATSTVAVLRLANGDGRFDEFFSARTSDGQRVALFLGEAYDGYSKDWISIGEALAEGLDPELDEARVELVNTASLLDAPALTQAYGGQGGSSGDARLAGKYVPMVFGAPFNVEPDTEDFAAQIDRWHVGPLTALNVVRDRGAPLDWDGNDWPDYVSLRAATVAPGFYTTALAIGRSKRGATAIGRITGDPVAPLAKTGDALLAVARGVLPDELIDAPSFGVIPDDAIDLYLKGDRAVSASEIFDALLRPYNGWYGSIGSRRLQVGLVASPSAAPPEFEIESHQIDGQGFGVRRFDEPPRWRSAMTGVRNWTPLAPSEMFDPDERPDLGRDYWEKLQRSEEIVEVTYGAVKIRHQGAVDAVERYGPLRAYFTTSAALAARANALADAFRRPMRRITLRTGLHEIFTRAGAAGLVRLDGRLGMTAGRPATVVRRVLDSTARALEFTLLVAAD